MLLVRTSLRCFLFFFSFASYSVLCVIYWIRLMTAHSVQMVGNTSASENNAHDIPYFKYLSKCECTKQIPRPFACLEACVRFTHCGWFLLLFLLFFFLLLHFCFLCHSLRLLKLLAKTTTTNWKEKEKKNWRIKANNSEQIIKRK